MLKTSIKTLLSLGIVAGFSLSAYADSLSVVPKRPTIADDIHFSIIIPNWDCCTHYYYDSTLVTVSDTAIYLSYQYDLPQVCPMIACFDIDKILTYKSAPLGAGTYAVYEIRSIYCSVKPCPLYLIAPLPIKIGEITVVRSTGAIEQQVAIQHQIGSSHRAGKAFTVRGEMLPENTSARVSVRGVCIERGDAGVVRRIVR